MNPYQQLAADVASIRKQVKALGGPQLAYSSLEDGSVNEYIGDQLASIWGNQYDGTHGTVAVFGPVPPTPSWEGDAGVFPTIAGLEVRWGGLFTAGSATVAPLDFSHVEVHVSTDPNFDPLMFGTLRGVITSARGGSVVVPIPVGVDVYVRLLVRTIPGKLSAPSALAGPFRSALVTPADLAFDLADVGGTTIFYGDLAPGIDTDEEPKIGDLWLKEPENIVYRFEETEIGPGSWIMHRDQGIVQAIEDAVAAKNDAARKSATFVQVDEPPTAGRTLGDTWLNPDEDGLIYAWIGDPPGWTPQPFGNGAFTPNSLIASDVIATGTITAALFEAIMVLATTIIAGDPAGNHARMTADGFQVYAPSPLAGAAPYIAVSMGNPNTADTFGVADLYGNLLTNIDETGQISARALSVNSDPLIQGKALLGTIIAARPRGVVGQGIGIPNQAGIIGETNLFGVRFTAEANRHYRVTVSGLRWANSSSGFGVGATFLLRDGGTEFSRTERIHSGVGFNSSAEWIVECRGGISAGEHNFVLSVAANGSSIQAQYSSLYPYHMVIEDLGPKIAESGQTYAIAAPEPARTVYQETILASWSQAYQGSGVVMSNAAGKLYQGNDPSGFNGNQKSLIGFPDLTGKLAGATVNKVELVLYAGHWYNNAGGTAVIGAHGITAQPATFAGSIDPNRFQVAGWARAQQRVLDVTSWDWKGGTVRGVVLGPGPTTSVEYYGQFNGHTLSYAPELRINYTK